MTKHSSIRLASASEEERRAPSATSVCFALIVVLLLVSGCFSALAQSPQAAPAAPHLDHFDVTQVDRGLDPCVDFYQYTCKKWIAHNPIPPDQANWWLGAKLMRRRMRMDILQSKGFPGLRRKLVFACGAGIPAQNGAIESSVAAASARERGGV